MGLGLLGAALRESRPEEALPILNANLALKRRYWPYAEETILISQSNIGACLAEMGRHEEALVLIREVYARRVAMHGVSDELTIRDGSCLAHSLFALNLWDEAKSFVRDQLLPVALRSLQADDDLTLQIQQILATTLQMDPKHTRDDLRSNQHSSPT